MNTFLEALLSVLFGIGSNKLLKRYGYTGKVISILVLVVSLLFFTYTPLMMNDIDGGDEYIPQSREDGDLAVQVEGGPGSITYEAMYDSVTIAFRTAISIIIFLFGAFAIAIS